jgi:hypothetical protein
MASSTALADYDIQPAPPTRRITYSQMSPAITDTPPLSFIPRRIQRYLCATACIDSLSEERCLDTPRRTFYPFPFLAWSNKPSSRSSTPRSYQRRGDGRWYGIPITFIE